MGQAFWTGVRLPSSPPEVFSGHIHGLFFYDLIYQKKYIDKIRLIDYDNLSKLIFHRKGVFDMIQPIKGAEKVNEVISGGNVIIGVSAPWCGYCRRLRPILEKISEEIDVPIYGLNFDEDQAVAEKYEVDTIPTLLFFRDGKPVDSIVGYGNVGYSELMEFVNKNNVK